MMKVYAFRDYTKIEYQWIIINFTDYFKFVDETKTYDIVSSNFDIDKREKPRFYLKMTFSLQSIVCSLKWTSDKERTLLSYRLSVVNKNGETFKTVNDINSTSRNVTAENQPYLKVLSNDLLRRPTELFPDNNFKVVCNLTVFEKDSNIKQLKSPKHHRSLKDHLKEILDHQAGSDVVFEVDGHEFKAHKLILMARSPVFSAMFNNDMIENNSNRVKVEDISSSIFELLIEFIYTDEIATVLDIETGTDMLAAASKYQLEGLESLCETELYNLLTVNNVLDVLSIAETYNCTDLVENIKNFVETHRQEIESIIKPQINVLRRSPYL